MNTSIPGNGDSLRAQTSSSARMVGRIGLGAAALVAAAFAAAMLGGNALASATTVGDNFNAYTAGNGLASNSNWAGYGSGWTVETANGTGSTQGILSGGGYGSAYLASTPLQAGTNLGVGQTISDSIDFNYSINNSTVGNATSLVSVGLEPNSSQISPYYYFFATVNVSSTSLALGLGGNVYDNNTASTSYVSGLSGAASANGTSDWFQLTFSITNVGGGNYTLGSTLYNLGANGTSTPTSVASLASPGWTSGYLQILTDSPIYGGIKSENSGSPWLTALNADNFSLTYSVPEPASLGLLGAGGLGLLLMGRKRRTA